MTLAWRDRDDPLKRVVAKGGKVLVVGLGRSGVCAANLLALAGCEVVISEKKEREKACDPGIPLEPEVRIHWGGHPWNLFEGKDLIVVSPGVPADLEPFERARGKGIPVIGEMELAFRLTTVPWVAVTGSNGKSTTVTLVDMMAKKGGLKVATGGNLGTPATSFVQGQDELEYLVAEVSSFQLETVETFHPFIAALLNLSPDHLDRYPGMAEYVHAKARIFSLMGPGDTAIFNADDPETAAIAGGTSAGRFPFSRFFLGKSGVFADQGWIRIRDQGETRSVLKISSIPLKGTHNLENSLAAAAIAWKMGVSAEAISSALCAFRGLEHRMELVGHVRGVPVYNDSKGTNVGATFRSLEGMGGQVILILGGKDKGAPYDPLVEPIRRKVEVLILLGEAADRMEEAFRGTTKILRVKTLDDAVREAVKEARHGCEILFSPACSSFDMFTNFEERGRAFKEAAARYMEMGE